MFWIYSFSVNRLTYFKKIFLQHHTHLWRIKVIECPVYLSTIYTLPATSKPFSKHNYFHTIYYIFSSASTFPAMCCQKPRPPVINVSIYSGQSIIGDMDTPVKQVQMTCIYLLNTRYTVGNIPRNCKHNFVQ